MFENFKNLKAGKLNIVNDSMLYPLLRWCSGSKTDLAHCRLVNQVFFFIPKNIQKTLLYSGLKDKSFYIKYPKSVKIKADKKFELQKELSKKYFNWSEQEFNRNISNLPYINWEEILIALGCEQSDYKILGIKHAVQIPIYKKPKKKAKTLMDF